MRGFIEIPVEYGNKTLLNVRYIEEVREHADDDTCTIYLAFISPNCIEQDYIKCTKSYNEIVKLIEKAGVI